MKLPSLRKEESKVVEQPIRSELQQVMDHLNAAHSHMDQAAHKFSQLIMGLEKGMNFVDRFRRQLTEVIQEAGGTVSESTNVEEAIAEFIPKNVKAAE